MTELAIGAANAPHSASSTQPADAKPQSEQAGQTDAPLQKAMTVADESAKPEEDSRVAGLQAQIQALEQQLRWEMQALEVAQAHVAQSSNAAQAGEATDVGAGMASDRTDVQTARSRVAGTQALLQVAKAQLTQVLIDSGRSLAGSAVDVRV